MTILANPTDPAVEVGLTVTDQNGGVTGLTVAASVYDRSREAGLGGDGNVWLNTGTGAWQATDAPLTLTEVGTTGHYLGAVDVSQATGEHLRVFYEITAGSVSGISSEPLLLGSSRGGITEAGVRSALLTDDTKFAGANIDATISSRSSHAAPDLSNLDVAVSSRSSHAAADVWGLPRAGNQAGGSFGEYVDAAISSRSSHAAPDLTNLDAAVSSRAVAGDAMTLTGAAIVAIWNKVRSSETWAGGSFGEFVDAAISSISAGSGLTAQEVRDALKLAPSAGAPAAGSVDAELDALVASSANLDAAVSSRSASGEDMGLTAAAVDSIWDELRGGARPIGSFGAYLDASVAASGSGGTGLSQQEVRDALKLAPSAGVPDAGSVDADLDALISAAANLDAPVSSRSSHAAPDLTNLDAAVSSRAAPGDAMALTAAAIVALWNKVRSSETWNAGSFADYLDAAISSAGGGGSLDAQAIRDALKLAPSAGAPAAGSVDAELDTLISASANLDAAVSSRAVPGSQMALTGPAVDAIWREQIGDHDGIVGSVAEALGNAGGGTATIDYDLLKQNVWEAILTNYSAVSGSAAEALLGAGGAFTPSQVASAALDALLTDHQVEGSLAKAVSDLDADQIRRLLEAAVAKLTRLGTIYSSQVTRTLYVGEAGAVIRAPIIRDGELADLAGASIDWDFLDPAGALATVEHPGIASGTFGHVEYVMALGDGLIEAAGTWTAQATVTFPGGAVKLSEPITVEIKAAP